MTPNALIRSALKGFRGLASHSQALDDLLLHHGDELADVIRSGDASRLDTFLDGVRGSEHIDDATRAALNSGEFAGTLQRATRTLSENASVFEQASSRLTRVGPGAIRNTDEFNSFMSRNLSSSPELARAMESAAPAIMSRSARIAQQSQQIATRFFEIGGDIAQRGVVRMGNMAMASGRALWDNGLKRAVLSKHTQKMSIDAEDAARRLADPDYASLLSRGQRRTLQDLADRGGRLTDIELPTREAVAIRRSIVSATGGFLVTDAGIRHYVMDESKAEAIQGSFHDLFVDVPVGATEATIATLDFVGADSLALEMGDWIAATPEATGLDFSSEEADPAADGDVVAADPSDPDAGIDPSATAGTAEERMMGIGRDSLRAFAQGEGSLTERFRQASMIGENMNFGSDNLLGFNAESIKYQLLSGAASMLSMANSLFGGALDGLVERFQSMTVDMIQGRIVTQFGDSLGLGDAVAGLDQEREGPAVGNDELALS